MILSERPLKILARWVPKEMDEMMQVGSGVVWVLTVCVWVVKIQVEVGSGYVSWCWLLSLYRRVESSVILG